jgi:hypothetical protein
MIKVLMIVRELWRRFKYLFFYTFGQFVSPMVISYYAGPARPLGKLGTHLGPPAY